MNQYTLKAAQEDTKFFSETLTLVRRAARKKGMLVGSYAIRALRIAAEADLRDEPGGDA